MFSFLSSKKTEGGDPFVPSTPKTDTSEPADTTDRRVPASV